MPEPNNSFATASALPLNSVSQSIVDGVSTTDLEDFYRFALAGRSSLNLTLSGLSGNADLRLLDSAGTLIQQSLNQATLPESINRVLGAGTYYLQVSLSAGSTSANYSLNFQAQSNPTTGIVWRNYVSGHNALWQINSSGGVSSNTGITEVADVNWRIEATGDFNGDGQGDLVWRYAPTGDVRIWTMDGAMLLNISGSVSNAADPWQIQGAGDFNGDGKTDLVWRNSASGQNAVWFLNGTSFAGSTLLPEVVGANWQIQGVGDFNGDRQSDLVWRNYQTGENVVWLLNGTSLAGLAFLPSGGVDWQIQGVGDFNGDAQTDLFWRNMTTGDNVVWTLNGTAFSSAFSIPTVADTNWRATAPFTGFAALPIDVAGNALESSFNIGTLKGYGVYQDTVSNTDQDFYQFSLSQAGRVNLNVYGAVEATLVNYGGLPPSPLGGKRLSLVLNPGTYFVHVHSGGFNGYTLEVNGAPMPTVPTQLREASNVLSVSQIDGITRDVTPSITGKAGVSEIVQLFEGSQLLGQTTTDANGNWMITTGVLADGIHTLTARSLNSLGDVSPDSIALTVDIAGNLLANLIQIGTLTDHDRRQGFVGSSNPADYYQFTLDASSRLNVVLDGLTANANVQLLNGAGQVLQSSLNPGTMAESLQQLLTAGTYYLRVSAAPSANTAYTLNLFPDPLPLTAPRLGTNLIQNGSFEEATAAITQSEALQSNGWISVFAGSTAIPHWQIQSASVDYKVTALWDASDGQAGIDLDGGGAGVIAQTFATLPGQTYRVTFDLSAHGHLLAGSTRPAIVSAAGQQAAFIGVSTQNRRAMGYVSQTWQFVAQDTQTTLSFASPVGDTYGALIDNVAVRAILSQPNATDLIGTTVPENSEAGTLVGQLSSGSDTGGDRYRYLLLDDAQGRFRLVGNQVQVAAGADLDFEHSDQHSIQVRVFDSQAPGTFTDQNFQIAVTNVNESPSFTSSPIVEAIAGEFYSYTITATDPEGSIPSLTSNQLLPSWLTLTDNGDGTALLTGTPTSGEAGLYGIELRATDSSGVSQIQSYLLAVNLVLSEQTNFSPTQQATLTLPARPSVLSFTIDPTFDQTDVRSIHDAFEVALVDQNGNPLMRSIGAGKDAFFNLTEGIPAALGTGVTYNVATQRVSLTLTGIAAGTVATLIFRLVNNDGDTATQVGIQDITLTDAPVGTLIPVQSQVEVVRPTRPQSDFAQLIDVSSSIRAEYHRTSYNTETERLFAEVSLQNAGLYSVGGSLLVAVTAISDPGVRLLNPDGYTPTGLPYYDFSHLIADGKLDPAELTQIGILEFLNPDQQQFTYQLRVLSQANQAPTITSQAPAETATGQAYVYQVEATDRDGDILSYQLRSNPAGMTINAQGRITWVAPANAGSHRVIVEVSDGHGGRTEQSFDVLVATRSSIANRPPVITSRPIVDATVNQEYLYYIRAFDADGDSLTYSRISSSSSTIALVNTSQGWAIKWVPKSDQLRWNSNGSIETESVTIQVSDGFGGTVQQAITIQPRMELGNHAPIITSTPSSQASINQGYSYQIRAIDPDNDPLDYRIVGPSYGARIDSTTHELIWQPNIALVNSTINFQIEVSDKRGGRITQAFPVTIYSRLGTIQGAVFEDLNNNGVRDTTLVQGTSPNIIFAIDISGSMGGSNIDWETISVEKLYSTPLSPLEQELASILVLSEQLILQGHGSTTQIGLVHDGGIIDLDPSQSGVQATTTPLADKNNNGIYDIREGLKRYQTGSGGGSDTNSLQIAAGIYRAIGGNSNIFFMSDGDIYVNDQLVADLRAEGMYIKAFGFSEYGMSNMRRIDPNAVYVPSPKNILDLFNGLDDRYPAEPLLEEATVYLDLNNNSVLDPEEPWQATKAVGNSVFSNAKNYSYIFENLLPGTYTLRQIVPDGYTQTTPTSNAYTSIITTAGESLNYSFGIHKQAELPNQDPIFNPVTFPPLLTVEEQTTYQFFAHDPEGKSLTYDVPLAPAGMAIDAVTGRLTWTPQTDQAGRFQAIVRVRDGKGGYALQVVDGQVQPVNRAPIFTSIVPANLQPQLNKSFSYQAQAIDPNGDPLTYSILPGSTATGSVSIDSNSGLVTWTPTGIGLQEFTIKASDGRGGETLQTIKLNVGASQPDRDPIILSKPRQTIRPGTSYFYSVEAIDPDTDALSYRLDAASQASGMILNGNILNWTPTFAQSGQSFPVVIEVSDDNFATAPTARQSFTLQVLQSAANTAPQITSTPGQVVSTGQTYQYNATGQDPEGDATLWSLDTAPTGMVIDSTSGAIRWQPQRDQQGEHTVSVRLVDSAGLSETQTFTLSVNGSNIPPVITSVPIARATRNQLYTYTVTATDPEQQALRFELLVGQFPAGMAIDPNTGKITWTPPTNFPLGSQTVSVRVTDDQGASSIQRFQINVNAVATNQAPRITSTPKFLAVQGAAYEYAVAATDADGDSLTYRVLPGTTAPGLYFDGNVLKWDQPTAPPPGSSGYTVNIGAEDGQIGAAQRFVLTVRENAVPVFPTLQLPIAAPRTPYRHDFWATDADGDRLTFIPTASTLAPGMQLDEQGRLTWTPTVEQIGNQSVTIAVTDGLSQPVLQTFTIGVAPDTQAPVVRVFPAQTVVEPRTSVTFFATATDNVGVTDLRLEVNGQLIQLDALGRGVIDLSQPQWQSATLLNATATAMDAAGNLRSVTATTVEVIDSTASFDPIFGFASGVRNQKITAPTSIHGTVGGDGFARYELAIAAIDSDNFRVIASGTEAVTDGTLGLFDPSLLQNDAYRLRLTVFGTNGSASSVEEKVEVTGDLKLGNFRLSFTDLSIPVTGIPINLTRTYDTLTSNTTDDFGYGWRMEFRDTDLRTNLRRTPEDELLGTYPAFQPGTRVYITLPGGKREAFTFQPQPFRLNSFFSSAPEAALYHPAFVGDAGVTSTLTVRDASSTYLNLSGGQYTGLGQLYNPANTLYGGVYLLTTKDGTVYEIDAISGDLLKVTDTNGNSLTYTDSAITSSTGQTITFERDGQNRIRSVRDPVGELIRYDYDEKGDLIKVVDREANTTQFKYDADPQRAHYLKEVIDPLNRTGARAVYDEATGRLKQIFDVNGNDVELIYDPANSVQIVKDTLGKETLYEYDPRGNIVREQDPEGREIRRGYDANNNVLQETVISDRSDPNPNDDVLVGFTTKYTYDGSGNKLSEETGIITRLTLAGQLLNEVSTGSTTRFTYGSLNRLATETDALGRTTIYGYDRRGNLTSTRDATGQETRYGYALNGQLFSVTDANQKTTEFRYDLTGNVNWVRDALGSVTEYEYDSNGNKTKETRKSINLGSGTSQDLITTWSYDSNGRVRTVTDALNSVTAYGYDKVGNQTWVLDGRGYLTEYRYTDKGELRETRFTDGTRYRYNPTLDRLDLLQPGTTQQVTTGSEYDAAGRRIQEIDQAGRVTRFEYDDAGRLVKTIYPDATLDDLTDNPVSRTEYYSDGTVKAQIDERGNRTEFRYDSAGRQVEVIGADETPNDPNDNPRTRFTYDQAGQQTAVTDALNFTMRYRYDDLGRQWKIEFADGSTTSTEYDVLGRRTAAIDPNGKRTEYRYDALGRLTGVKDALNQWTEYGYNGVGNLLWQEDAIDHRTTYAYDALGRRSTVTLPLAQQSTSTYDALGNLKTYTDFNGKTTTYSYNALNQLQKKEFATDPSVSFTYTATGMRSTVLDAQGTTVYEYDQRDRLTRRIDPDGRSISYTYDAAGNRTSVTTPSGTVNYTFDAQNRLDQVWQNNIKLADYTYNAVGSLTRTQFANGTEEVRSYDNLHRLTSLENKKGNTILSSYAYTLDKAGNRMKVDELGGRSVTYTYDDLYRLTREAIDELGTGSDRTFDYSYDNVGNRLTKREKVGSNATTQTNYSYDNNDRLLKEQVNGQDVAVYTYDHNGNTLTKTESGVRTEYTWNDENRLVSVTTRNSTTGAIQQQLGYVYNSDGIRVATIQGGQTTRFLVDANRDYAQVLEEYSNGQVQTSYVYGLDLISQTQHLQGGNQNKSYYLVDGLGSTRLLTNGQGNVLNSYTYEAFGSLIGQMGSASNQYLFAGEQFDANLGDYYLRDRYYDTSSGRFTRRDSFEGGLSNPLTLHKYIYANDNPVLFSDPTGRFSILSTSATIGVLTSLVISGASDIFFPNPLQAPTQSNDVAGNNPYKAPFEILAGLITGVAVTRYLLSSATVQVFRVEGSVNARVLIGEGGEVLLDDSGKMLFLNFGQKARAQEFLAKRLGQGMSDAQSKSFKIPRSYLDEIRASSVPESLARRYPDKPIQVDVTKAPDQFGLRSAQITQLQRAIIQGSGKVEP